MKTQPSDVDAEKALLGCLMMGAAPDGLVSADFYRPAHQLIYEAIEALRGDGKPAEPIAVADELRRRGQLTKIRGADYLHTCYAAVPSAAQAGHYAGIVRELAERRGLIEHAERLRQQAAINPGADIADVRALAADVTPGPAASRAADHGRKLVLTPRVRHRAGAGRLGMGGRRRRAHPRRVARPGRGPGRHRQVLVPDLDGRPDHHRHAARARSPAPRGVIYVAVEDSWKYTIVPRLMAAGADLNLVYRAEVQAVEGDTVSLSLPADNRLLEEAITGNDIAMVAIDPLMSAIGDAIDTHVNRQVRQALDPLARIADRTGAVFAGIAHFNKSSGTDASSLITASGAFKDVARFIFAFAADAENGTQVITQTKNSLGHSDLPSLAYRIIEATVPTAKGDARVGRFVVDGPAERTVQDILSAQAGGGGRTEKARAEEYLEKALAGRPAAGQGGRGGGQGGVRHRQAHPRPCPPEAADPGAESWHRLVDLAAHSRG